MEKCRLLLFDLDGTLLCSDKTISPATLNALRDCREKGMWIGISTSRSEQNALAFIEELRPDVLITSGGALVKYKGEYVYRAGFSKETTRRMIGLAREVCGQDCQITIDTADAHYWNYKIEPKKQDHSWGESVYTDFMDFEESALKMCVEIFEEAQAKQLAKLLDGCDCVRFSDGYWYKFTKKEATKEQAIRELCSICGIGTNEITAFGDDYADIGMLKLCGTGIAMDNAVSDVKKQADLVIGSNDEDGIANYLSLLLTIRRAEMKTLVVYYSQSGNAQWMAQRISSALSADMLRLVPKKAYPAKGFGKYFFGGGSAVMKEAPELEPYKVDLKQYGRIVFVTPVWAGTFTPPLRTFIQTEDLEGKQFGFAACSLGGSAEKAFAALKSLLGMTGDVPTLWLVEPKQKQKPENERAIEEFCGKL